MTTRAPKAKTVTEAKAPEDPEVVEAKALAESADAKINAEVSEGEKSAETKCDNHPHRYGRNFTGGNVYNINLCDECTPSWFLSTE